MGGRPGHRVCPRGSPAPPPRCFLHTIPDCDWGDGGGGGGKHSTAHCFCRLPLSEKQTSIYKGNQREGSQRKATRAAGAERTSGWRPESAREARNRVRR